MAKLYAEIGSDKKGRKASKGGDSFLQVDIIRGNSKIGTLGVYEVGAGTKTPAGYRVIWHIEGQPYPKNTVTLTDTAVAIELRYCTECGDERAQEGLECKFCHKPLVYVI